MDMTEDTGTVNSDQIPSIVTSTTLSLDELNKRVEEALSSARAATGKANEAKNSKMGLFSGKKKAIKSNQEAIAALAKSGLATAEVLELSLQYQAETAKLIQRLFDLGASNIALTRATIQSLESTLRSGAASNFSDDTKEKLKEVIRDLKAKEDFMQKQAKTENIVKQHEKRVSKLEKRQKFSIAAIIVIIGLVIVLAVTAKGPLQILIPINITNPVGEKPADDVQNTDSPASTTTDEVVNEDANISTDPDSILSPDPDAAGAEVPSATIDMDTLVGEAEIGSAYFSIFASDGKYYFNFVIREGSRTNYLSSPVPLTAHGRSAIAAYDDDHQGNSGTVTITCDDAGKRYITAEIGNKWVSQYDSNGCLNALIFDNAEMYYSKEIKDYPIYQEYLDVSNWQGEDNIDVSFLLLKSQYHSYASNDSNVIVFSDADGGNIRFSIKDPYDDSNIQYQGTVQWKASEHDYVVLTGYDEVDPSVAIEIEGYYDGYCRVKTSDGVYQLTVFK